MATIPCSIVEYVHYSRAIEETKYCVVLGAIKVHDSLTQSSILSYESNDQCRKIMRGVSPTVFLGSHLASRWSNLESFIWYTWHLRSGHMVTYIVKVHA